MEILSPDCDLNAFYRQLAHAPDRLLMLDYDGTLSPFTPDRDNAKPYPDLKPILEQLVASNQTRTVIISGRSVDDLKRLLDLTRIPELWGSHGIEQLDRNGQYHITLPGDTALETLSAIRSWADTQNLTNHLEQKPAGLAFHWRGLDSQKANAIRTGVRDTWSEKLTNHGLELHSFDGGIEIRHAGITKGNAVSKLLTTVSINTPCAYLGDDLTDEDAFTALGNRGLRVLVRPQLRETAADLWLIPPNDLIEFLRKWI